MGHAGAFLHVFFSPIENAADGATSSIVAELHEIIAVRTDPRVPGSLNTIGARLNTSASARPDVSRKSCRYMSCASPTHHSLSLGIFIGFTGDRGLGW